MSRRMPWILGLVLALSLSVGAPRSEAKRAVRVYRVDFTERPSMAIIPDTQVYYLRDESQYDLYQYGNTWYLVDDGNWYRAPSWRGPFVGTTMGRVPRMVVSIPAGYRKNWVASTSTSSMGTLSGTRYWSSGRTFTRRPSMTVIPQTQVFYSSDSRDYGLYRLGNSYFLVDDGNWYRGITWRGPFTSVRVNTVPRPILNVPTQYRVDWTTTSYAPSSTGGTTRVRTWTTARSFRSEPRMVSIPETRVYYFPDNSANEYDVYRFGSTWYVIDNGSWYRASSWRGPFVFTPSSTVPREILTIPVRYRDDWDQGTDEDPQ